MKQISALRKAVKAVGTQAELARRISKPKRRIKQQHVSSWLNRDKKVPPGVVLDIERETGVSRHDLCPEVFGPAPEKEMA